MGNNFNNKINDLQHFTLEPNAKIWVEVEKQLPKEKKLRIVAWWWSMPILLGFSVWGVVKNDVQKAPNTTQTIAKKSAVKNEINITQKTGVVLNKSVTVENVKVLFNNNKKEFIKSKLNTKSVNKNVTIISKKQVERNNKELVALNKKKEVENNEQQNIKNVQANNNSYLNNNEPIKNNAAATENKKEDTAVNDKKNSIVVIKKIDSSNAKKETTKPIFNKKINFNWVVGGGLNYVSRNNLIPQLGTKSADVYAVNPSVGLTPQYDANLSLPKTGFNFSVGINGNYVFTQKFTLQFGLQYNYLQNNISLKPLPQTVSFMYDDKYTNGNLLIYKNTFHFISIPISYQYCFNPLSKNNISIIAGASIEYAIAKNTLYIDNQNYYYQKNNTQLNNLFAALHTGFSFNFNNKFSINLLAKKYTTSVQKNTSKYYWQQINFQLNIPFNHIKK